jgi:hypothetical protein
VLELAVTAPRDHFSQAVVFDQLDNVADLGTTALYRQLPVLNSRHAGDRGGRRGASLLALMRPRARDEMSSGNRVSAERFPE